MKPKIIHFIDSFSKGGAEVLLAGIVPYLEEYDHYIFYLYETDAPLTHLLPKNIPVECFHYRGLKNIFPTLLVIRRRFKAINPDIVHTHLIFATLFARIILSKNIPLITTYHNAYYRIQYSTKSARVKNSILRLIDKFTYSPRYTTLHVSAYQQRLNDKDVAIPSSTVLYNYAEDVFFHIDRSKKTIDRTGTLRLISVGNLKTEKNHILVLQAIKEIQHIPVSLDIYGEGRDRQMLQKYIDEYHLPVTLKGDIDHLERVLSDYDLFILASTIEGFGISVTEAMAAGLPVLLSDIDTFKEVTEGNALFFQNNNVTDLAKKIEEFYHNPSLIKKSTESCKNTAEKYRKDRYVIQLKNIYAELLKNK